MHWKTPKKTEEYKYYPVHIFIFVETDNFSVLQCVILTEAPLALQLKVNDFCRSQESPICVSISFSHSLFRKFLIFCGYKEGRFYCI